MFFLTTRLAANPARLRKALETEKQKKAPEFSEQKPGFHVIIEPIVYPIAVGLLFRELPVNNRVSLKRPPGSS